MGEKDPEQMENVQLSVDPPSIPTSETTSEHNVEGKEQSPTPQPNDLVRKLMGVFAASTALGIFLWFMAGAGFPWFIYIVYAVSLIDSIIYAVKTKNSFFANWTIYASTNIMLFITFLACGGGYPWFFIPLSSMAIFPVSQYIWKHYDKPLRYLYIHAAIYLLINTMIFFIWVTDSLHTAYPWFIYPWCGWGVLLLIHYNCVVMHDKSRLFVFVCADLGIMLMITFRFAIGPLFMVFLLVGLAVVLVYYLFLKKGYAAHCWCMKRRANTAPQTEGVASAEAPAQPPAPQGGFSFGIPQFHMQLQPAYQNMPPPPPGSMYFSAGQAQFPYQGAPTGPTYYAYFPSNGGLYPTLATVPAQSQGTTVVPPASPAVQVPSPSDAVLASDVFLATNNAKAEEEEDSHLLRNSPPRYSPSNNQ